MDFTREPIVETVMTPREGYRLVVRSSKNLGQEEHFVDALEIIAFGSQCFFRNIERPKSFLLPVSDYEVLEVREPKIILKTPSIEGTVKISGGRSDSRSAPIPREPREVRERDVREKEEKPIAAPKEVEIQESLASQEARTGASAQAESVRSDRRKDRRRTTRNKPVKAGSTLEKESMVEETPASPELEPPHVEEIIAGLEKEKERAKNEVGTPPSLSAILAPPTTLIRDDIARLKANELYKGAFYELAEIGDVAEDELISPFIATPEEPEEEVFEDYRARPEPAAEALSQTQDDKS